jgi:hypothetical protein
MTMGIGHDRPRPDQRSVLQLDAHGTALAVDRHARDLRIRPDRRPGGLGRAGHGLRHTAHAALHPAPRAEVAVDLADPMVHQDVRRARGHRPAPRADDRLRGKRSLDPVVVEPFVEEVGGAHREQPDELVDVATGPTA